MTNILVVGAGPTGLTMAAVLARHGLTPRIIDKAIEPPADRSRAIVLQARTLELFDDLGIVREVLDAALVVAAANVFTQGGGRGTIAIRPEWIDSLYGRFVTLPQEETERILGELVARSGIRVERGTELTGFEEDVTYSDWSDIESVRHPTRAHIAQPARNADAKLTFKSLEPNVDAPQAAFRIDPPRGLPVERVDCR